MRLRHYLVSSVLLALTGTAGQAATSLAPPSAGAEPWARVEMSREDLTAWLGPVQSIDYGRYQWIAERHLPAGLRLDPPDAAVTVVERPFVLHLGGESFDPLDRPLLRLRGTSSDESGRSNWWLVQFVGPSKRAWLEDLTARSLLPAQYIHPFTYAVWGEDAAILALEDEGLAHIRAISDFRSSYKMSPMTVESENGQQTRAFMALVANDEIENIQSRMGGAIGAAIRAITSVNSLLSVIYLSATGIRGSELADLPGVYSLQDVPQDVGLRGEIQNQVNAGQTGADGRAIPGYLRWLEGTGYDGADVTVSIVDNVGFRASHQALVDNVTICQPLPGPLSSCSSGASSAHATHVAGAVAGTGATGIVDADGFLRGLGVAPGARLVSQNFLPLLGSDHSGMIPDGMALILTEAARSGALIANNSWGPASTPRGYDIPTLQVDMAVRDADPDTPRADPLLAVWAIMNGRGDRASGVCAPSSLGSPDEAKNLFAVGATYLIDDAGQQVPAQMNDLAWVSGHGNACDGRRAPHIVAPGCNTDNTVDSSDSAHSHGGRGQPGFSQSSPGFCGTSMAAPNVAGAAAIFMERHRALHGHTPSPALIKAAFTAVARDLAGHRNANRDGGTTMGHRPDRYQGYGRLDLDAAVNPTANTLYVDQTHVFGESGEAWTLRIEPEDPSQPVRIMLAWTDSPGHGLGGATAAWVNDLDLRVRVGTLNYLGNVVGADGWSAAGGSPDGLNNLEGVFLSPEQHSGQGFDISILANNIAADALAPRVPDLAAPRQDFALACYNCTTRVDQPGTAADLALVFPDGPLPAEPGAVLPVTFGVIHSGPVPTQPLSVTFELPEGLSHVHQPAMSSWQCTGGGRQVRCQSAADGSPGTLAGHIHLRVDQALPPGQTLTASARVSARGNSDPVIGNNGGVAQIIVGAPRDALFSDGFESAAGAP